MFKKQHQADDESDSSILLSSSSSISTLAFYSCPVSPSPSLPIHSLFLWCTVAITHMGKGKKESDGIFSFIKKTTKRTKALSLFMM